MRIARRLRRLHHIDDALVGGLGIGIDDDQRVLALAGGTAAAPSAMLLTSVAASGDLLTSTWPLAVTATSTSLGCSACLLASAVGRLISRPENLAVGRGQHQEDDDDQQHVDHRESG